MRHWTDFRAHGKLAFSSHLKTHYATLETYAVWSLDDQEVAVIRHYDVDHGTRYQSDDLLTGQLAKHYPSWDEVSDSSEAVSRMRARGEVYSDR